MRLPRVIAPRMIPPRLETALARAATVAMTAAAVLVAVRAARRRRAEWKAGGRPRQRRLNESALVAASRQEVYWLCRDVPRLAHLADPRIRVIEVDDVRSKWEIDGSACTVEITGDVPELLLSWQVEDGPVRHHGRLTLHPASGGTRITAQVRYDWPPSLPDIPIDPQAPRRMLRHALDAVAEQAEATARQRQHARSGGYRG